MQGMPPNSLIDLCLWREPIEHVLSGKEQRGAANTVLAIAGHD